jgi:hypothetical protein
MLRTEADANDSCRNSPQIGPAPQQLQGPREREGAGVAEHAADDVVLNGQLETLRCPRRELSAPLDPLKLGFRRRPFHKNRTEDVGGGNCVLDGQVDSDPADRRHGMCGIADAEKPWPRLFLKAVDRHRQDAHVFPVAHFFQTAAQERFKLADFFAKRRQAAFADAVSLALGDDEGGLSVCIAVEQNQNPAEVGVAEGLAGIVRAPADAHLQEQ